MVNSTLISVPSEIDEEKLQGAIQEVMEPHVQQGTTGDKEAVSSSLEAIQQRITSGEFGAPPEPHSTYDVTFTVGQNQLGSGGDWHVNFVWHWG